MTVSGVESLPNRLPERLTRRADFLAMRGAGRFHAPAFVLQARKRGPDEPDGKAARFGLTITRKVGNAVERNRIRRRLREAVRRIAPGRAAGGFDYVLVARRQALSEAFDAIVAQLAEGLDRTARLGANPRQREPARTKKPARTSKPAAEAGDGAGSSRPTGP